MNKLLTVSLNKISGLRKFFIVFTLFLGVSISGLPAAAATASSVPIETVHFVGGRLVQAPGQSDLWTEYDFNGAKRYTFETKSYDKNTLRLKGQVLNNQTGQVELLININNKSISGEWPGHRMAQLYRITKVDYFATMSPDNVNRDERGNAVEEVPQPQYRPPGKKQPAPLPVPDTSTPIALTPAALRRATYEGGYFSKQDETNWVEQTQDGNTFSYDTLGYDDRSVFLYDLDRKVFIELNVDTSKARISRAGGAFRGYASLIEVSNSAATPMQPVTEPLAGSNTPSDPASHAQLSAVEKAVCMAKGGFVERAGLLGAERCTRRYSDGGNICIDSSNCQGKCLTDVNAGDKGAVSGLCQKTDNPFGCYSEVLGGKVQPGLCVD